MPVDRSRLPPLAGIPHYHFPHIERRTLETGLRVWTIEQRAVPLVSVLVLTRRGAAADPAGCEGLAAIVGDLLDEGAGDLDALGLHEALGRIGAQLDTEVGSDATLLSLTVLSRFADRGVALLASMIREGGANEQAAGADWSRSPRHPPRQLRATPSFSRCRSRRSCCNGEDP